MAPSRSGSGRWRLVCDTNFTGVAIGAYLAVEKMEKSKVNFISLFVLFQFCTIFICSLSVLISRAARAVAS